jgi:hypothetical protein
VIEVPALPDPAPVDPAAVLASIANDPAAPAHARVTAARALLVHQSGGTVSKPTALEELNERALRLIRRN